MLAVYSSCLSLTDVDGDVQAAVVVEDSEDVKAVVAGDWEGEDVVEGASDAGDGESVEADNLEISWVSIEFGSNMFVSVLTISRLLGS